MLEVNIKVERMGINGLEWCDSIGLVEGDVIRVREDVAVVVDCVLIKGEVVVDEAVLTGESLPIQKQSIGEGPRSDSLLLTGSLCL
jgi:P-type E1-E2 ATPase